MAGFEVDILFAAERVIVELDSWGYHRSREAFERDRERDAATSAAGHLTYRLTWERFHGQPDQEAARLHAVLQSRRPRGPTTTPAEAQVASANGRSSTATPARSG